MKKLTKKQKARVARTMLQFDKKMQSIVDKAGDGITGISVQFGDNEPIQVAGRKAEETNE